MRLLRTIVSLLSERSGGKLEGIRFKMHLTRSKPAHNLENMRSARGDWKGRDLRWEREERRGRGRKREKKKEREERKKENERAKIRRVFSNLKLLQTKFASLRLANWQSKTKRHQSFKALSRGGREKAGSSGQVPTDNKSGRTRGAVALAANYRTCERWSPRIELTAGSCRGGAQVRGKTRGREREGSRESIDQFEWLSTSVQKPLSWLWNHVASSWLRKDEKFRELSIKNKKWSITASRKCSEKCSFQFAWLSAGPSGHNQVSR